jgi:hypothetical protein
MTLDREFHIKRIVPAQPKSFRTIIEEERQSMGNDMKDLEEQAVASRQIRPATLIIQGLREALAWVNSYDPDAEARRAVEGVDFQRTDAARQFNGGE